MATLISTDLKSKLRLFRGSSGRQAVSCRPQDNCKRIGQNTCYFVTSIFANSFTIISFMYEDEGKRQVKSNLHNWPLRQSPVSEKANS